MKKQFVSILSICLLLLSAGCGQTTSNIVLPTADTASQRATASEQELISSIATVSAVDLASLDEEALQDVLAPYLEAYDSCLRDTFGTEVEETGYLRCYGSEEDSFSGDPSTIKELIPDSNAVPEGLFLDPAYAYLYPVTNFRSMSELQEELGQWIDLDADFLKEGLALNFNEFDDALYLVRGGRGYGVHWIDPDSAKLVESGDTFIVEVDFYTHGEKEESPARLTFEVRNDRLLLTKAER